MSRSRLRVGLADDSVLVREALTSMVSSSEALELVAVCATDDEVRAAVSRSRLDVVVTEIPLPPGMADEGIRLAVDLRRTHPHVGVVVLSSRCEPRYAVELLAGGSSGRAYLLKDLLHDAEQVLATVAAVARGGSVIDPKVVEALVQDDQREHVRPSLAPLTPRERDILAEMARGASNQGIAETLELPKRAVEKGINAIFAKLDLHPTPEVSRRVRAVLIYLLEGTPANGRVVSSGRRPAGTPSSEA